MSMVDDACPRCGAPVCACQCKPKPKPPVWQTPWNGELRYEPAEHLKAFTEKIMGHIRRELAYRNLAAELLQQLKSMENFVDPTTRGLLRDAREVWEKRLDEIAKL